jgi:hypothetical protein
MTVDIRAQVICDLGEIISGGWSDDHVQGTGLIRTRGEVIIKGIVSPSYGQHVNLGYVRKYGNTYYAVRMPRYLLVLSVFADPFRRQTTIQLGCPLTFRENFKGQTPEELTADTWNDPLNNNIACTVFEGATISISAGFVASEAAKAIGLSISPTTTTLTNFYTVEQFDLSPGYVQVLSDLLISENRVGYINAGGSLQTVPLTPGGGSFKAIREKDIIDISSINSGQLPGAAVAVSYSYTRFKDPPDDVPDSAGSRDWEEDRTEGPAETRTIQLDTGDTYFRSFVPVTTVRTEYDSFDRVITRTETRISHVAATNPSYLKSQLQGRVSGIRDVPDTEVKVTTFNYETPADRLLAPPTPPPAGGCRAIFSTTRIFDPDRDGTVLSQTEVTYKSEMSVAGALGIVDYNGTVFTPAGGSSNWVYHPSTSPDIVAEVVTTTFETDPATGISKTVTTRQQAQAFVQSGQQVGATEAFDAVENATSGAQAFAATRAVALRGQNLVNLGSQVSTRTDRTFGLQRRPSRSQRNNNLAVKTFVESTDNLDFVFGSQTSENVVTYRVPYSSDDRIGPRQSDGKPILLRASDAPQKAAAFAKVQNSLAFGHRNGFSLQLPVDAIPTYAMTRLSITASGLSGAYVANGISWSFDSNGIVCNVDALLLGGAGTVPG